VDRARGGHQPGLKSLPASIVRRIGIRAAIGQDTGRHPPGGYTGAKTIAWRAQSGHRPALQTQEYTMCFAHSGTAGEALHVQAAIGADAAAASSELATVGSLGTVDVAGSGTPEAVVAPPGERVLDGYSRVMQTG
jgi:hypothetical protein